MPARLSDEEKQFRRDSVLSLLKSGTYVSTAFIHSRTQIPRSALWRLLCELELEGLASKRMKRTDGPSLMANSHKPSWEWSLRPEELPAPPDVCSNGGKV